MIFPEGDIHSEVFSELKYGNPSQQQTGQDEKQPDVICFPCININSSDPGHCHIDTKRNAGQNGYPENSERGLVQVFSGL